MLLACLPTQVTLRSLPTSQTNPPLCARPRPLRSDHAVFFSPSLLSSSSPLCSVCSATVVAQTPATRVMPSREVPVAAPVPPLSPKATSSLRTHRRSTSEAKKPGLLPKGLSTPWRPRQDEKAHLPPVSTRRLCPWLVMDVELRSAPPVLWLPVAAKNLTAAAPPRVERLTGSGLYFGQLDPDSMTWHAADTKTKEPEGDLVRWHSALEDYKARERPDWLREGQSQAASQELLALDVMRPSENQNERGDEQEQRELQPHMRTQANEVMVCKAELQREEEVMKLQQQLLFKEGREINRQHQKLPQMLPYVATLQENQRRGRQERKMQPLQEKPNQYLQMKPHPHNQVYTRRTHLAGSPGQRRFPRKQSRTHDKQKERKQKHRKQQEQCSVATEVNVTGSPGRGDKSTQTERDSLERKSSAESALALRVGIGQRTVGVKVSQSGVG
eukprot:gb/GEZN01006524.1/.p1 GENE.gb/GEZN01006524.1/~~gb/GEZN01006524.1/.p1  ORF type:complete len:444 (+),score=53.42 gb/GEZN01006524.1/:301-1632(+)